MADDTPSSPFDQDFDAIQAAVLETARGRWFLAEFARRNRVAETDKLLGAIQRLERTSEEEALAPARRAPALQAPPVELAVAPSSALLDDLKSLLESVAATNAAVQAVEPAELGQLVAPDAKGFDRVVDSPDDAHATILAAAEHIQETVWMLREQGAAPRLCDELDRRATQVFAACAYGDVAARRTAALVQAFAALVEQASTIAGRHRVTVAPAPARAQPAARKKRPAPVSPPPLAAPVALPAPSRDADLVFSAPAKPRPAEPPAPPQVAARLAEPAPLSAEAPARPAEAPARPPQASARPPKPFAHLPDSPPPSASDRPRRPTTLADIDALTAREKLRLFT